MTDIRLPLWAVEVRSLQLKWWAMRTMRRVKGGVGYHYA
ncbi:hypothetical protein TIFTF001_053624 [Ficus carica]|uniref:Uncharacterized protein n=1 Tax=Ficus carica TaxID=3494 RepID=A0AA88JI44_FICCA|nr:hypothetical protein TIFTF001_053624 [Ficus carica]